VSERLTGEELRFLRQDAEELGYQGSQFRARLLAAVAELRDRRAADLTPEEREALAAVRDDLAEFGLAIEDGGPAPIREAALAALDKLTKGTRRV
jgi:hypothetical protein